MLRPMRGHGYTLLELLVVLAVAGFIMASVASYSTQSMPGTKLKSAAQQLEAALRRAQTRAIAEGIPVSVTFVQSGNAYVVEPGGDTASLPPGTSISFTPFSFLPNPLPGIRFYPDGSAAGGDIAFIAAGRSYHLVVDWLTSRVTLRG